MLLASTAQAAPIQTFPLKLVVVKRADITTQQQVDLFNRAITRFSEVGVRVKVTQVIETEDVIQENDLDSYWHRLFTWADWGKKNKLQQRGMHVHYLLPPVTKGSINYGGGAAGATCTTRKNLSRQFSYSIMRLVNQDGSNRIDHSLMSAVHELLHSLGANHIENQQNIMRSYYTPGPQPILSLTKKQLNYCNQGKNPLGVFTRRQLSSYDPPFS